MPKKLHGMLNLSKIPRELITTNRNGDKVIWIDVLENLRPSQFGDTHSVSIYDRNAGQAVFVGNLTEQEFGKRPVSQPAPAPANNYRQAPAAPASAPVASASASSADESDLPFD